MFDPAAIDIGLHAKSDAQLARIEEAGLNAAQPPEQLLIDGWLLRFSPGKARRSRSVNAISAGRMPLAEKIELCRRWFERFRLPLLFRITPFSQPETLDDFLAGTAFVAFDETRVMACPLAGCERADGALDMREVGVDDFVQTVGALRASPQKQIDAHARRLRISPLGVCSVRMVARAEGGRTVAAGQVVVEDDLAGLYDIVTAPSERGRGYGRAISRRLLAAASAMGARMAYLQVDAGNVAARRIYSALGFVDRYAYWYRRPAGTSDEVALEDNAT